MLGVLLLHCQSWGENCRKKEQEHHRKEGYEEKMKKERIKQKDKCDMDEKTTNRKIYRSASKIKPQRIR